VTEKSSGSEVLCLPEWTVASYKEGRYTRKLLLAWYSCIVRPTVTASLIFWIHASFVKRRGLMIPLDVTCDLPLCFHA